MKKHAFDHFKFLHITLNFTALLSEAKDSGDRRLTRRQILILMCYSSEAFDSDKASSDSDADAFRHNTTGPAKTISVTMWQLVADQSSFNINQWSWRQKSAPSVRGNTFAKCCGIPRMQNLVNYIHAW